MLAKTNKPSRVFHVAPGSHAGRGFPGPCLRPPSDCRPRLSPAGEDEAVSGKPATGIARSPETPLFTKPVSAGDRPHSPVRTHRSPLNPDPSPALRPQAPPPPHLSHRVRSKLRSLRPRDTHSLPAPPARTPSHRPPSPHPGPPPQPAPARLTLPGPQARRGRCGIGASSRFPSASLLLPTTSYEARRAPVPESPGRSRTEAGRSGEPRRKAGSGGSGRPVGVRRSAAAAPPLIELIGAPRPGAWQGDGAGPGPGDRRRSRLRPHLSTQRGSVCPIRIPRGLKRFKE